MESQDCHYSIIIKEENELLPEYENTLAIKIENEPEIQNNLEGSENTADTTAVPHSTDNGMNLEASSNMFHTAELLVKQEVTEEAQDNLEQNVTLETDASVTNTESSNVQIKEEESTDLVSYDYPNFEDTQSMDSNDATALGVVETCLQDDMDIKEENDDNHQDCNKEDFVNADIKIESDLTVTETQLTSQQVNTGISNGPLKHSLVMKFNKNLIRNMKPDSSLSNALVCTKTEIPDEFNTDTYCNGGNMDLLNSMSGPHNEQGIDESFQLNSITGDMLTLEQQAYGVLPRKQYPCSKCSKICFTKGSLKRHLGVHQTIENYKLGRIKGRQTRKENILKRLEQMKDSESESDESNLSMDKDSNYQCICQKVYHRRSRMETCLRSHDFYEAKKNLVKCTSCLKNFKDKEELAVHRKKTHRKRFPCKFCPTDYATRKELFKHLQIHQKVQLMEYKVIEEVVKGKQKLRCFMCSKSWTELSELKIHVLTDHKGPYLCPHCERNFPKIVDFANHTRTRHPEVEGQSVLDVLQAFSRLVQEWKCEECALQFLEADKFALHKVEQHSPELKYESQFHCPDCRRVFVSQKGLTSHRRIHHLENVEETKIEELGIMCLECRTNCKDINALTSHMRFHSPDRKYACKFCDFRFATPEKRKAHAELHTGEMKFVCFICEYQCSSENRLKQHKMSLKHVNMREYLLTGKPLVEESTSKEEQEKLEKKFKKERRKRKAEESKDDKSSSSSESDEVECDICGEKFPSEKQMLDHKQTHPFIEFPNEDTPTRIFFK